MNLSDKVVFLTGGGRMGGAISRVLSDRVCSLVLGYRRSKKTAEDVVGQMQEHGRAAWSLRCDVAQRRDVERAIRQIEKRSGRLDVVVNLASAYARTPLESSALSQKSWTEHMEANAQSAFGLSLAAAPLLRRSGGGRIIHFSDWTSASGRPRYFDYGAYYVSKVAVKGVVEALALALAPAILVNAIAPGPILPPAGMSKREISAVKKSTPLRRWGGPDEIAKAVLFLCETDFVTGETLRVDGGRHLY